mgnify:CR=1 FL=1
MNKELNAAEAVYGFVGWLTSREERTVMSAKDDCAPIAELIKRFCTENNLPEVSDQWPLNLIHPSGEVAVPDMTDAYAGAREDLSIWKKRALEAEALNRKFAASVNSPSFMGEPAAPVDVTVQQDAERYRWLRDHRGWQVLHRIRPGKSIEYRMRDDGDWWGSWWPTHEQAIDAAITAPMATPQTNPIQS